jgi:hypothetical protein
MKQFNQSIYVEIQVDAVAQQLRAQFNENFPFADQTTEMIIGRILEKDERSLGMLYQTMNGYKTLPLPKVNERYNCELYDYAYWTPDSITQNSTVRGKVTECKVIEVFEFSDEPLLVEFLVPGKDGTLVAKTKRVAVGNLKGKV